MPFLKQSFSQTIRFGPFLDKTDGVTEETGLTLTQADMRLSKDGSAFAQKNAAGNATHDSDGWYSTTLNATDTDTVGELILNVHQPANALPIWVSFTVVEEAIYDGFFAANATEALKPTVAGRTLDVTAGGEAGIDLDNTSGTISAAQIAANAFTAAKFGADFITAASIADNSIGADQLAANAIGATQIGADAITAAKVAADVHAETADAVWDELKAGHVGATTFGDLAPAVAAVKVDTAAILVDTADIQPKIGTPAADVSADIAAVKAQTALIETDTIAIGSDTTAILADTADIQPKIGAPAADLAADIAAVKVDTAAIVIDTVDLQARTPAALVGGRTDASVGAMAADVLTAAALATDAVDEIKDAILPVKNAAFADIPVSMVDDTDHFTPKTGLTLTVTRSIDGGAFGAGTGTASEISNGNYSYDASAADMNGKVITFRFVGTAADDTIVVLVTGD